MRSRRTNHFQIASIFQEAEKEKIEQQIAQIAILTCETAHDTIAQGVHNILDGLKEKHKSKYEYNKERKRDFRVGKKKVEHKVTVQNDFYSFIIIVSIAFILSGGGRRKAKSGRASINCKIIDIYSLFITLRFH
jgi:hypothetical protein